MVIRRIMEHNMLKLVYNNRTILNSARTGYVGFTSVEPPTPPSFPSDMDFVYLANDFDGTQIPRATTAEEDSVIKDVLMNQSV